MRDLSYPIEIIGAPIVRAEDGLALSSRNQYLSNSERNIAPVLHQELQRLAEQLKNGEYSEQGFEPLVAATKARITEAGFSIDYLDIKTAQLDSLKVNETSESFNINNEDWVVLVAAWLGRARLLDNQLVTVKRPS